MRNRGRTKRSMVFCEVVRVDSPFFLINSRHIACRYETADGGRLTKGHYLALWPSGGDTSFHGREVRYLGPFMTKAAASMLRISAQWLDIVDLEREMQTENDSLPTPRQHDGFTEQATMPTRVGVALSDHSWRKEVMTIPAYVHTAQHRFTADWCQVEFD